MNEEDYNFILEESKKENKTVNSFCVNNLNNEFKFQKIMYKKLIEDTIEQTKYIIELQKKYTLIFKELNNFTQQKIDYLNKKNKY